MTWNQGYTQKKQKEMNKAIKESNKQIKKKLKKQPRSPYTNIYATSTWGAQEKRRVKNPIPLKLLNRSGKIIPINFGILLL